MTDGQIHAVEVGVDEGKVAVNVRNNRLHCAANLPKSTRTKRRTDTAKILRHE